MSTPSDNPDIVQHRPDHKIAAVLAGKDEFDACVRALADAGSDVSSIDVLHGEEGILKFDLTGEGHGPWAAFVRSWKNMGGADADMLSGYDEALRRGSYIALFPAPADRQQREPVVALLQTHGATAMNYFTPNSMETLSSANPHTDGN